MALVGVDVQKLRRCGARDADDAHGKVGAGVARAREPDVLARDDAGRGVDLGEDVARVVLHGVNCAVERTGVGHGA